jgi:hypothetical protein
MKQKKMNLFDIFNVTAKNIFARFIFYLKLKIPMYKYIYTIIQKLVNDTASLIYMTELQLFGTIGVKSKVELNNF